MIWVAIATGTVTSCSTFDSLETDLLEVAPTFFAGVPRMFEAFHERVRGELLAGEGLIQRSLFDWGVDIGRQVSELKRRGLAVPAGLAVKMAMADKALFTRVRQRFGDRLRFLISGSAPLAPEVAEFFHAAGILILEGYGMTETCGAVAVNRPERFRFGTVGPTIAGAEIRIAKDGEVLVRGDTVMKRYHGIDEQPFDAEGWLHTGDRGQISAGFLRITGRKKDLVIISTGKNIAPRPLEDFLRARRGIAQAVVLGDQRPYLVALIAVDFAVMMGISRREGLGCRGYAELAQHPRIRQIVQEHVDELNADRARFEQIRDFAIPLAPFAAATGELTVTRKVKRGVIQDKYRDLVERLYPANTSPAKRDLEQGKKSLRSS
jgi:long-chain acyl-CoA synthetase